MLPTDTELQKMSNEQLSRLWAEHEKHTTNSDWVRVAKEVRYRNRFNPGVIDGSRSETVASRLSGGSTGKKK